MRKYTSILFIWYFVVQSYGSAVSSTVSTSVVGPFPDKESCEIIRKQCNLNAVVTTRTTDCWSDKKEPDGEKELKK